MTVHDPLIAAASRTRSAIPDDAAMLRAAADLTRELSTARPAIYWPDMLASAIVGYAALTGAILTDNSALMLAFGLAAMLVAELGPTPADPSFRSEEHTSELQSLMRISYAVFCLKKNTHITPCTHTQQSNT